MYWTSSISIIKKANPTTYERQENSRDDGIKKRKKEKKAGQTKAGLFKEK